MLSRTSFVMLHKTDLYHAMTWPGLSYVAEDHDGRIVGYILAKMCVYRIVKCYIYFCL